MNETCPGEASCSIIKGGYYKISSFSARLMISHINGKYKTFCYQLSLEYLLLKGRNYYLSIRFSAKMKGDKDVSSYVNSTQLATLRRTLRLLSGTAERSIITDLGSVSLGEVLGAMSIMPHICSFLN